MRYTIPLIVLFVGLQVIVSRTWPELRGLTGACIGLAVCVSFDVGRSVERRRNVRTSF